MICHELNVPEVAVTVSYKQTDTSNDRYERTPTYNVTSVEVTVDNTKINK
jgi:hypothetical protein